VKFKIVNILVSGMYLMLNITIWFLSVIQVKCKSKYFYEWFYL